MLCAELSKTHQLPSTCLYSGSGFFRPDMTENHLSWTAMFFRPDMTEEKQNQYTQYTMAGQTQQIWVIIESDGGSDFDRYHE